jgi:hypothetical protein
MWTRPSRLWQASDGIPSPPHSETFDTRFHARCERNGAMVAEQSPFSWYPIGCCRAPVLGPGIPSLLGILVVSAATESLLAIQAAGIRLGVGSCRAPVPGPGIPSRLADSGSESSAPPPSPGNRRYRPGSESAAAGRRYRARGSRVDSGSESSAPPPSPGNRHGVWPGTIMIQAGIRVGSCRAPGPGIPSRLGIRVVSAAAAAESR